MDELNHATPHGYWPSAEELFNKNTQTVPPSKTATRAKALPALPYSYFSGKIEHAFPLQHVVDAALRGNGLVGKAP